MFFRIQEELSLIIFKANPLAVSAYRRGVVLLKSLKVFLPFGLDYNIFCHPKIAYT